MSAGSLEDLSMMIKTALLMLTLVALLGCAVHAVTVLPGQPPAPAAGLGETTAQDGFWRNLTTHCGSAFRGRLTLEPPGDDMLTGTEELIVHFRECSPTEIRAPFHIEKEETGLWDRSRTWVFTRTSEGLELRHDHRRPDGTPDESTWYGGSTRTAGSAQRQEFIYAERTGADGSVLGWRVEIVPGERYTYGTIRGGEWTWRVDFDLREAVPAPPAPWGFQ
jgi:hypothetical protein